MTETRVCCKAITLGATDAFRYKTNFYFPSAGPMHFYIDTFFPLVHVLVVIVSVYVHQ